MKSLSRHRSRSRAPPSLLRSSRSSSRRRRLAPRVFLACFAVDGRSIRGLILTPRLARGARTPRTACWRRSRWRWRSAFRLRSAGGAGQRHGAVRLGRAGPDARLQPLSGRALGPRDVRDAYDETRQMPSPVHARRIHPARSCSSASSWPARLLPRDEAGAGRVRPADHRRAVALAGRHRPREWLALAYAWNPLVVLEIAHSGHIDALGALWIAASAYWLTSAGVRRSRRSRSSSRSPRSCCRSCCCRSIWRRIRPRDALAGAVLFVLLYLPFISGPTLPFGAVPNVVATSGSTVRCSS